MLPYAYQAAVILSAAGGLALLLRLQPSDLAAMGAIALLVVKSLGQGQALQATWQKLHFSLPFADQLQQAVEAYRAVAQTSPHFDHALYELAWTYIRMGDAIQAERALEVLSVAAPDSPLNADGKILRGDLLARVGRYEEAEVVFDEVRELFGPIRDDQIIGRALIRFWPLSKFGLL